MKDLHFLCGMPHSSRWIKKKTFQTLFMDKRIVRIQKSIWKVGEIGRGLQSTFTLMSTHWVVYRSVELLHCTPETKYNTMLTLLDLKLKIKYLDTHIFFEIMAHFPFDRILEEEKCLNPKNYFIILVKDQNFKKVILFECSLTNEKIRIFHL